MVVHMGCGGGGWLGCGLRLLRQYGDVQRLALAKILTPAQRQQMAEKHKARQERRQDARKSHRAEHP